MHQRLEDLGKIYILVHIILEKPIFSENRGSPKDFVDWFYNQNRQKQIEILEFIGNEITELEQDLMKIGIIAKG